MSAMVKVTHLVDPLAERFKRLALVAVHLRKQRATRRVEVFMGHGEVG